MRISVKKNDKGYSPEAWRYQVTFNGELLSQCFTADEETGEAFVYVLDARGRPKVGINGEAETLRIVGAVKVSRMAINAH